MKNNINIVSINFLSKYDKRMDLIIDIRDREKYLKAHIPGATNYNEKYILDNFKEFKRYRRVYIYCDYGNSGLKLVRALQEKYLVDNVYNVIGGYNIYRGKVESGE